MFLVTLMWWYTLCHHAVLTSVPLHKGHVYCSNIYTVPLYHKGFIVQGVLNFVISQLVILVIFFKQRFWIQGVTHKLETLHEETKFCISDKQCPRGKHLKKRHCLKKFKRMQRFQGKKSEKKSELSQQYLSIFSVSCMHWLQSKRGMCHVYLSSYIYHHRIQCWGVSSKFYRWLSSKCLEFIHISLTVKTPKTPDIFYVPRMLKTSLLDPRCRSDLCF